MRSKEEMLRESLDAQAKEPAWDTAMSKHEHLIIEVLLDIRDQLSSLTTILGSVEEDYLPSP